MKKAKKTLKTKAEGITLIALVVTIIVLLILAGISISMLTGENGILNRAKEAGEKTEIATEKEQRQLAMYEASMNISGMTFQEVDIPAGFAPTRMHGESTVEEGLVITDSQGNEFVWIPVPKAVATEDDEINDKTKKIQFKKNNTPMALTTKENEDGTKEYRGILYENWKNTDSTVDVKAHNAGNQEPSIVNKGDFTYFGKVGLGTVDEFKNQMQRDYNEMVESVAQYGGFYVARYEMSYNESKVQYKRGEVSAYQKDWYEYYSKQRSFADQYESVKSSMIWGSQYDAMMNWIARCGIDVVDRNTGSRKNTDRITGAKEEDKINNIYDLLGNSDEWTLEAYLIPDGITQPQRRIYRGGDYKTTSSLANRWYNDPNITYDVLCSRSSLYIM